MSQILIIAEHDGTHLNPGTAKCVTCAAALAGASITVAVPGLRWVPSCSAMMRMRLI